MPEELAFSRSELRRRRDQLMAIHHPDRGGDPVAAARLNETYARMTYWLERRDARAAAAQKHADETPALQGIGFRARAAKLAGAALVALATLAAMRNARRR